MRRRRRRGRARRRAADVVEVGRRRSRGRSARRRPPSTSARRPGPVRVRDARPAPRSRPAARTSSPVARTATRGRRWTDEPVRRRRPARARPRPASPSRPGASSVAPASEVAAGAPDRSRPAATGSWTRHAAGSGPVASRPRGPRRPSASSGVVISTGTTASAPGGSGAPGRDPDRGPAARPSTSRRRARPRLADDRRAGPAPPRSPRRRPPPGSRSRPSPSCPTAAARRRPTAVSAMTRPSASAAGTVSVPTARQRQGPRPGPPRREQTKCRAGRTATGRRAPSVVPGSRRAPRRQRSRPEALAALAGSPPSSDHATTRAVAMMTTPTTIAVSCQNSNGKSWTSRSVRGSNRNEPGREEDLVEDLEQLIEGDQRRRRRG